jgi:hypothetical protein
MSHDQETIEMTPHLARVRADLLTAIVADQRRAQRPRRVRLGAIALVATLAGFGTAVAATTGVLQPAPDNVKGVFERLDDSSAGPGVDASKAVRIGAIDDHAAYAAPAAHGGFCLYFAENPRSGPSGSACTAAQDLATDEISLAPQLGSDGGFVFGRVGTEAARTVEIAVPGAGTLTARVGQDRFFLAALPERAMRALIRVVPGTDAKDADRTIEVFDQDRIDALRATAKDADGNIVARSKPGAVTSLRPTGATTTAGSTTP